MTAERWLRIEALFGAALERPRAERAAFVREEADGDPALQAEVEALLAAHESDSAFLDAPALPRAAGLIGHMMGDAPPPTTAIEREDDDLPDPDALHTGDLVGPYRLLRPLGRGGMGQVFLAVRDEPSFEQHVAIKVIRRGLDTADVLRRFLAERQILASLHHPHIARLLDGGATPDGRPYVVMEWVDGERITTFCDRHRLSVDARLTLFQQVCDAVQHAHQNLVVHRDLKPSNILVTEADGTGHPSVKLLDFGIAKLLTPDADALPLTRTGMRLLTPDYASPEQVSGALITTASDVYQLGVLLYELLTGHRPHQLTTRTPQEIERVVCEEDPTPLSAAVAASTADTDARDPADARRLRQRLRGDLETITAKALQKDPARRYGSVEQLADDVRRHLDGLPVRARPDTLAYRVRKFVRRHRVGVAAASLSVLVLVAFSALTAIQAARTQAHARAVELERNRAEEVVRFLVGLFEAADPTGEWGTDVTARHLLEAGLEQVDRDLAKQPEVRAAMLDAMGHAYLSLGAYDEAERLGTTSLALRQPGPAAPGNGTSATYAPSLHLLGVVAAERSNLDRADSLLGAALALQPAQASAATSTRADWLLDLAWVRLVRGQHADADSLAREALDVRLRHFGPNHPEVAEALTIYGIVLRREGAYDRAIDAHRQALAIRQQSYGPTHYLIGQSLNNLAIVLENQASHVAAESLLVAALPHYVQALGAEHPITLQTASNLAKQRYYLGDYAGADSLFQQALDGYRTRFGNEHSQVALFLHDLGSIRHDVGALDEAEALHREGLAVRERVFDATHVEVGRSLIVLAGVLVDQGEATEAEGLLRRALAIRRQPDIEQGGRAGDLDLIGAALHDLGYHSEAEALHREALSLRRTRQGPDSPTALRSLLGLGRTLTAQGEAAEAEPILREALRHANARDDGHWKAAEVQIALGACLTALGRRAEAEAVLTESLATLERSTQPPLRLVREARAAHVSLQTPL